MKQRFTVWIENEGGIDASPDNGNNWNIDKEARTVTVTQKTDTGFRIRTWPLERLVVIEEIRTDK